MTRLAGLPLVCEFMEKSDLGKKVGKYLKLKEAGWSERELVETIVMLVAAGGKHLDDVRMLAADNALQELLGKRKDWNGNDDGDAAGEAKNAMGAVLSPKALERFLKMFHDDSQKRPGEGIAWVPKETYTTG